MWTVCHHLTQFFSLCNTTPSLVIAAPGVSGHKLQHFHKKDVTASPPKVAGFPLHPCLGHQTSCQAVDNWLPRCMVPPQYHH